MSKSADFRAFIARRLGRMPDEPPREPIVIDRPVRPWEPAPDGEPRFRTSATDRGEMHEMGGLRVLVREAFMPSQPVSSRAMLAGRRDLLQHLIHAIEDQRAHVVLYGERGIGKTSLLRVFIEIAREAGYLVVHENCGAASEFDELFTTIAAGVPLLYHGAISLAEAQDRGDGTLADLLPATGADPRQVSRVFAEVTGTRSIIILDEFDRVQNPKFQAQVAELIKNLSDSSARVQLVIAGVAQNLHDLLGHSPSIRRNVLGMPVGRMEQSEIAEILTIGQRHSELSFSSLASETLVEMANGLPYLARLLAHHAALSAIEDGRREVNEVDVGTARGLAVSEMEGRLTNRTRMTVRDLITSDRAIMAEIGRAGLISDNSFEVEEIASKSGSSADRARHVLEQLVETGVVMSDAVAAPARFRLNPDEGLVGYVLLATASGENKKAMGQQHRGGSAG